MLAPFLPPEVWATVFYWATYGPARELLSIPYFNTINYFQDERDCRISLSTKYTLSLVCKCWRALSVQFLYEDLHISHGAGGLLKVLQNSKRTDSNGGYGRLVRRIVLPAVGEVRSDEDNHWATVLERQIMGLCPELMALSRYHEISRRRYAELEPLNHESADDDSVSFLRSIKRIDWGNGVAPDRPRVVVPAPLVTWLSETLEVLSLGGENFLWSPLRLAEMKVVRLPRVHTLRIASACAFGVPDMFNYDMDLPSLRRIILDKPEALYRLIESCLLKYGHQVKVIEIGAHWRFLQSDYVSTLLNYCPNVETLLFPIFWTRLLRWRRFRERDDRILQKLRHVGLHAAESPDVEHSGSRWTYIEGHFKKILGQQSKFSSIRTITLHGTEWAPIVADSRFSSVFDLADTRGVKLTCEDPVSARSLAKANAEYSSSGASSSSLSSTSELAALSYDFRKMDFDYQL